MEEFGTIAPVADAVASPVKASGIKPRMRGVPDLIATLIIVPAAAFLMGSAQAGTATIGAVVYSISLAFLFGMSTTYHLPMWPPKVRAWLRRGDHSAIYVLIAGSYTPVCLTLFPESTGTALLVVVWGITLLGTLKSLFWPGSPRWLNTLIYLGMGWLTLPFIGHLMAGGVFFVAMLAIGGVIYSIGAVIYTKRWCDWDPSYFGYHEVFHLFVIAAAAFHYAAMWDLLV